MTYGLYNDAGIIFVLSFVNVSISVEVKKETSIEKKEGKEGFKTLETKNNIKIITSPIIASQKIGVRDFVRHFRNRYIFLKKILQQKKEAPHSKREVRLNIQLRIRFRTFLLFYVLLAKTIDSTQIRHPPESTLHQFP